MKPIKITKVHQKKLLKICKKLFPEYTVEIFDLRDDYNANQIFIELYKWKLDSSGLSEGERKIKKQFQQFHWYEFCLTHLATALYNKLKYNTVGSGNNITIAQYRGHIAQNVDHSVDFLYEEFLRIE